jgi:hypothetical protein
VVVGEGLDRWCSSLLLVSLCGGVGAGLSTGLVIGWFSVFWSLVVLLVWENAMIATTKNASNSIDFFISNNIKSTIYMHQKFCHNKQKWSRSKNKYALRTGSFDHWYR